MIHIRRLPNKEKRGLYTDEGVPTCFGNVPMEYVETDHDGRRLYRCRAAGCHLAGTLKGGTRHCDTEYWQDPTEDIRLFGAMRRNSKEWNGLYGQRWTIEQLFKSLKQSRRLEGHCVRGMAQISLHSTMSMLAFSATALAEVRVRRQDWMRWMVRRVA